MPHIGPKRPYQIGTTLSPEAHDILRQHIGPRNRGLGKFLSKLLIDHHHREKLKKM